MISTCDGQRPGPRRRGGAGRPVQGVAVLLLAAPVLGALLVGALELELPVPLLAAGTVALVLGVAVLLAGAGWVGLVASGSAELEVVTAPLLLG